MGLDSGEVEPIDRAGTSKTGGDGEGGCRAETPSYFHDSDRSLTDSENAGRQMIDHKMWRQDCEWKLFFQQDVCRGYRYYQRLSYSIQSEHDGDTYIHAVRESCCNYTHKQPRQTWFSQCTWLLLLQTLLWSFSLCGSWRTHCLMLCFRSSTWRGQFTAWMDQKVWRRQCRRASLLLTR